MVVQQGPQCFSCGTKNTQIYETHNYSIIPNLSLYYLGESKIVVFMDVIAISSLKFLSVKITN